MGNRGNGMRVMMGTWGTRVGTQGIRMGMQGIRVGMRGMGVRMRVYKYLTGILQGFS